MGTAVPLAALGATVGRPDTSGDGKWLKNVKIGFKFVVLQTNVQYLSRIVESEKPFQNLNNKKCVQNPLSCLLRRSNVYKVACVEPPNEAIERMW